METWSVVLHSIIRKGLFLRDQHAHLRGRILPEATQCQRMTIQLDARFKKSRECANAASVDLSSEGSGLCSLSRLDR